MGFSPIAWALPLFGDVCTNDTVGDFVLRYTFYRVG